MSQYDPFRIRHMPKTMTGFQAITFLLWNPCGAPPMLYFETLLPVAGTMFIRLADVSPEEIVGSYFRPQGVRSGRHFRRGRRGGRGFRGIPDVNDGIAKFIPGAADAQGRTVSDGVRNLWFGFGLIQQFQNNILMADILDDGLVQWAQLVRLKGCNLPFNTQTIRQKDRVTVGGVVPWQGIANMQNLSPFPVGTGPAAFTFSDRGGIATISATVKKIGNEPGQVVKTRITQGGKVVGENVEFTPTSEGNSIVASASVRGNVTCVAEFYCNPGFAEFEDILFTASPNAQ